MKLHTLHRGCGGTVEIDLRLYPRAVLYAATCEKCGAAKEGRKKRPQRDWERNDDHEEVRVD